MFWKIIIIILVIITMANFYPPDENFKRAVEESMDEILPEKILDLVWNKYFYYNTFFESLDGWSLVDASSGSSIVSEIGVQLHTGATTNNVSGIVKAPRLQETISFDNRGRFRTAFRISNASTGDIEANITVGLGPESGAKNRYGFRIISGNLTGIVSDGTNTSTVTLISSFTAQANYIIEARLLPSDKVVFLVSDADSEVLIERGSINTNLPSGSLDTTSGGEDNAWIEYLIKAKADDSKIILFSFFEYIQSKF